MLKRINFCSHSAAAHGASVKQNRAASVAVSAAAVGACNATIPLAAEVTAIPRQSRITPIIKQAHQLKHAAGRAEGTKTALSEQQNAVCSNLHAFKEQQIQHWQDAVEQQTAGAAVSIAAISSAQQQQHRHTDAQMQQHQQHSKQRRKSWTPYHDKLLRMLRQRPDLLPAGSRVLLAVSGGQDSMALLRLLSDLSISRHWPLELTVAHCDHSMRPDSADNAAFVQQTAQQLGLECHVRTAQQELRGEDAARKWRLSHLQDIAQQTGCRCYALGHTATDRAETLLFNLIRGAGAAGLSSMGWERKVLPGLRQVRPLLWMDRADTAAFCEATGMQLWEDSTNHDHTFAARNLLRLSVFPHLLGINSKAVHHIAIASELLEAEDELLRNLAQQQLQLAEVKYVLQPGQQQQSEEAAVAVVAGTSPAAATQQASAAGSVRNEASTPHAAATVAAANAAAASNSILMREPTFDAVAVSCMPDVFQPTIWYRSMPAVSQSVQAPLAQPQKLKRQASSSAVAAGEAAGIALDIQALLRCPRALRSRVIWMWLQQQLRGVPTYLMVQEVLRLLLPRKGNGAKTGTLQDSCCVTRHKLPCSRKQLLVLVDIAAANQLHAGELRLRLESDLYSNVMRRRRAQAVQQRALQQLLSSLEAQPTENAEQQCSWQWGHGRVEISGQGVVQAASLPNRVKHANLLGAHFQQQVRTEVTIQHDGDSVVVRHKVAVKGLRQVQQQQPEQEQQQEQQGQQEEQQQEQQQQEGINAGPRLHRTRRQWQRLRLEQKLGYNTT